MITFLHATRWYRSGGIRDFDCQIERGELVVFEGPVGSGKTTLIRLLTGIEKPDSGRIVVNSVNLHELGARQLSEYRRQIGIVSSTAALLPDRNLLENVALPLYIQNQLSGKAVKLRALDALTIVGLTGRAGERPATLSTGEKARVELARALANEPSLLLLDDPLAHMDTVSQQTFLQAIGDERENGATIIVTAVNAEPFQSLLPRRIRLCEGRIVSDTQFVPEPARWVLRP
ncbi:MAG: ATP-binding cassette domain-containing protein [bacterium]|nr:ATP-binding cassette domain-containing protein [bacterium]